MLVYAWSLWACRSWTPACLVPVKSECFVEASKPKTTSETNPFWQACRNGRLIFQKCSQCHNAQFPPSAICTRCGRQDPEWLDSSGEGAIYSITTVQRAPSDYFKGKLPYFIALVDIDEGFRMMLNVRAERGGAPKIGDRIKVYFEDIAEDFSIPQAKLA